MSAINSNPLTPYPPVQNGKQRSGGLLTMADKGKLDALYQALPTVRVTNSAQQIVATGTITQLTFDTETYDLSGYHSLVSNTGRLTIPAGHDGLFAVGLYATWDAQAGGGRRSFAIRHQGVTVIAAEEQAPNGTSTFPTFTFDTTYRAAAGEYFDAYAFHDRGSNLGVITGYTLWLVRLGG